MLNTLPRPKPKPLGTRGKRRKKSERQILERKLDTLVRTIVIERDKFCVCPAPQNGHSTTLQPGHLISRVFESIKWDLFNVSAQCRSCNMRHEYQPNHYRFWFRENLGMNEYYRLEKDSWEVVKMSVDDLKKLYSELEAIRTYQVDHPTWKPYYSQKAIFSGAWRGSLPKEEP